MHHSTYHDLINEEFEKRKQINSAYSLRAFARDLGISAPRLSQILNKKQGLSLNAAQNLAQKLKLNELQKTWFCDSVGSLHARGFNQRSDFKNKFQQYKNLSKIYTELQLEYFKVISDWYHFAILELTYHKEFKSDADWISKSLGVEVELVREAISRMKTLELLKEENGKLVDVFKFLAVGNDVPSIAHKKFNSQLIKKALEAMFEQDVNNREYSSNIIAFNKEELPVLKEKLRKFRRELDHDIGSSKEKNAVYCLSIQFFELTKES
jgi:uncharacterized protein (TIGR02147 family)